MVVLAGGRRLGRSSAWCAVMAQGMAQHGARSRVDVVVAVVGEVDLAELLPLVRAYCDFYEVAPTDAELLALSRALIADPRREGVQFLARTGTGSPAGFATVFWTWDTTEGGRIGVMNDLFVVPTARGSGVAEALVSACRRACRDHGAVRLNWITAPTNARAQAVYDRIGATREQWISYGLPVEQLERRGSAGASGSAGQMGSDGSVGADAAGSEEGV
jgi:GNAT superfamily N-acetyltransferase